MVHHTAQDEETTRCKIFLKKSIAIESIFNSALGPNYIFKLSAYHGFNMFNYTLGSIDPIYKMISYETFLYFLLQDYFNK